MSIDIFISAAIGFLVGVAAGASGKYLADRFTDQRRAKESRKAEITSFKKIYKMMPDLLDDMKSDICTKEFEFVRKFFVLKTETSVNSPGKAFLYYDDDSNSYLEKARILEEMLYIEDISPGITPMFRMSEDFVGLLKNYTQPIADAHVAPQL